MQKNGRLYLSYFSKYESLVYGIFMGTPCITLAHFITDLLVLDIMHVYHRVYKTTNQNLYILYDIIYPSYDGTKDLYILYLKNYCYTTQDCDIYGV